MGFGNSICTTEITFDKNQYAPGEVAKVKILCDNSKCSKPVQSFKFKLKKKFSITATSEILGIDQTTTNAIYLVTHKVPAQVKAKETADKIFDL